MKKISLLVLAVCMMAGTVIAQSNYIRLGVGGGIGLKQYGYLPVVDPIYGYNDLLWANITQTETTNNIENKSMGLGSGFNVTLAFGHMFSQYVGIELGVNEFIGLNKKINLKTTTEYGSMTAETKMSGKMLQIVPAIVITPGLEDINPYARVGMIIGILPSVSFKDNLSISYTGYSYKSTSHDYVDSQKLSGGVALGFTAAGGASYSMGENFSMFAELVFNGISYAPSKGKYKEWTEDGIDQMPTATTNEKEWTYEKKYDADEDIPDGSPAKYPKMSLNFSNVEINIGVIYKL